MKFVEDMHVLNFSVGRIQPIQIGASVVKTAHIKTPVPEPWRITFGGADGDQRAVHPDKLYAFARNAYDYWSERLGVDRDAWSDGFFGENLTLDTLDETDIRVGDIFAVGNEVQLVVSGARTPCAKLAWRLNQPRSFQKTFARSRQSGVYFDVIEPGRVCPGDALTRIAHDPEMPSVAEVCDIIDSHKAPPLDRLMRLLDCKYLSPANRMLLGAKRELAQHAENAVENRWSGWRQFTISVVKDEAQAIKSFELTPVDGKALCMARPGQFVGVRLSGDKGNEIDRSWSLSDYREDADRYRITVLRQNGVGSRGIHALRAGDKLKLRAPAGAFVFDMGSVRPPVFVAAGVGVTPIMAMLEAHFLKKTRADAHLVYATKTPEHMAFRDRIEELLKEHSGFHVTYVFSRAKESGSAHGRITSDTVKGVLNDLHIFLGDQRVSLPWFEADFYICGPDSFCDELKNAFARDGADPSHIYTEQFDTPPLTQSDLETACVRFLKSGKEASWNKEKNLSLLELAEETGIQLNYDCRAGSCLTCKTKITKGATTADMENGVALLCIGRPKSDIVEIDA